MSNNLLTVNNVKLVKQCQHVIDGQLCQHTQTQTQTKNEEEGKEPGFAGLFPNIS
jgi:hypothetical protein